MFSTKEDLDLFLEGWQAILRLQDWTITSELSDDVESLGECEWDEKYKYAHIKVMSANKLSQKKYVCCTDQKVTALHELVHLHFCSVGSKIKPDSHEYITFEGGIDFLARALLSLKID